MCFAPQPTASSDNTLLNLHNSSDDTQLHSVIILLIIFKLKGVAYRKGITRAVLLSNIDHFLC